MAKDRARLRDFQQSLAQRLANAKSGEVGAPARLGVLAGSGYWLVDLTDAGEIVPVPELLAVPLTKPWFAGVANIRGNLVSVVDFSAFIGQEPTQRSVDARLLLGGQRFGINSALLVTRMMGLRTGAGLKPQAGFTGSAPWVGEGFSDDEGRLWHELRLDQLFSNTDYLQVGW
jgi:twitching motility protein PilI